jgi:hypothetical protein
MKILELSTDHLSNAQELARAHGGSRIAEGTHVSEIIRDIQNKVTHKGKRKKFSELSSEERRRMGNFTSMGWAFERVIESALCEVWGVYFEREDRYTKTGSLCLDGITGTPDWLDQHTWSVVEFKATWKSSRRDLANDFASWLWQIKAYCKMLATTTAELYVFFVNGDYRESGPQLKAFSISFTRQEIDENWAMLKSHARGLGLNG